MATPTGKLRIDTMGLEDLQSFAKKQMTMLKNLKNKADQKSNEVEAISKEKKSITEELECEKEKSKSLEETLRRLEKENEVEREDKNDKSDELEFEHEELKVKFEEQEEKLEKFREMAKEKVESLENRIGELQGQVDQTHLNSQKVIDSLNERIAELEAELFNENREDSLGELEEECQKLHELIDRLNQEKQELEDKLANQGQLDRKLAESTEKQKESSLQLAQAEDLLKSTQEELEQLKTQTNESNDQKLAESIEQQKQTQIQLAKLEEQVTEKLTAAFRVEIEQVKTQSTESENQLNAELDKSANLVAQIKSEHDQSSKDLEKAKHEIERLKTELKSVEKVASDTPLTTQPENSENEQRIAELQKLLSEQAADLAATRNQLKSADTTVNAGDLEKSEVQNKKLKQLALKTKKEIDSLKKKLEKSEEEKKKIETKLKEINSKASNATSSFQAEYDRLQDELDQSQADKKSLTEENEELKEKVTELSNIKEEKEMAKKELSFITEKLSTIQARLDNAMAREVQLESEMVQEKRARLDERTTLTEKVTKLEKQLEAEKTRFTQSTLELENTRESMKTQQLMNMEMMDYERAVNELKNQVEIKTNEANAAVQDGKQIQELLDQVRQRATAAEEALEAAEERSEKYRAMIDEANVELNDFKDKQQKTQSQIEINSAEAEHVKGQLEELKIALSTVEAQNTELLADKKTSETRRERERVHGERELAKLKLDLDAATMEKETIEKEFNTYKARVHTVLKQQKSQKTDPNQLEQAKDALLQAHDQIKRLHVTVEELKSVCSSTSEEKQKIEKEFFDQREQMAEFENGNAQKERALLEKIKTIESEQNQLRSSYQTLKSELEQTKHDNRRSCEEAESRVRSELGLKLSMSERRTTQLEGENHALKLRVNQAESDLEKRQIRRESSAHKTETIDVSKMERSEPIGAEQVEDDASVVSLEQILTSPSKSYSIKSEQQPNQELVSRIQILEKKIEHQSSILHETEATNARLADQSGLLKAEIRRLEANQDRKDNIHNLEYLKNIIYKFVTLAPGTERQGLIPVLETMLQFNQTERETLNQLAIGDDDQAVNKSGWGSYVPRWGGL